MVLLIKVKGGAANRFLGEAQIPTSYDTEIEGKIAGKLNHNGLEAYLQKKKGKCPLMYTYFGRKEICGRKGGKAGNRREKGESEYGT